MTRLQLLKLHKQLAKQAVDLMAKKNHDYAGIGSLFANFERCEAMGICTTEQGFLVRQVDKLSRLATFTQKGKLLVKDESIRDTVIDIINYAVLFYAYQQSKTTNET